MRRLRNLLLLLGCCLLLIASGPADLRAADDATVFSTQGVVELRRSSAASWEPASNGVVLHSNDELRTSSASRAALVLSDGLMVRINENSLFRVQTNPSGHTSQISLDGGKAHFFSRETREFPEIKTPLVSASIRGTEFIVDASAQRSSIAVISGQVFAENALGKLTLGAGEEATIEPGRAPTKSILLSPLNAVQWSIHYSSVLDTSELPLLASQMTSEESVAATSLVGNDAQTAAATLAKLEHSRTISPAMQVVLAHFYLSRGQVARAESIHAQLEKKSGLEATLGAIVESQKTIIALTRNELSSAMQHAERAAELSPRSAAASLALSYALQAKFELPAAAELVTQATSVHLDNALLKLRAAELALSLGDAERALSYADAAAKLAPELSSIHCLRGFAALAALDSGSARKAFELATLSTDADGLAFLGLGLAEIRNGELEAGRLSIQKAVELDPTRALYRSYLGKALYEQDREAIADEELTRAATLDPQDPTAFLYRSFERLTAHRPVEALEDIERSISLNDNRAVYRSRLLLDEDNSVRTSSLAEIYDTLGFSELARIEAIKSVSRDYSNYSAHQLLSRSYEGVDDLTQASLSEFFIARLLSPVNFNLVRPSQAGLLGGNDYTAAFDRDLDRVSLDLNAGGREHALEPHALFSGTHQNWGYALDYGYRYARGYRENDTTREHTLYGAAQYQLGAQDTLLLDTNVESSNDGDTELNFDPNSNNPDKQFRFDDYFLRMGFRHRFSAESQVLGQFLYNHSNLRQHDGAFDRFLYAYLVSEGQVVYGTSLDALIDQHLSFRSHGIRADLQHVFSSASISNVAGAGVLDSQQKLSEHGEITFPEELATIPVGSRAQNTEGAVRVFDYLTWHAARWVDAEMGISFNRLHLSGAPLSIPFAENTEGLTTWDPKLGMVITPWGSTTLRAAYFEGVGSAGAREFELIEPTTVGGFNQTFFDIYPGTRARNRAIGLDQKFGTSTFLGLEALHRDITRRNPLTASQLFFSADDGSLLDDQVFLKDFDAHLDEDVLKAYAYRVLGKQVSLTSDYLWTQDLDHFLDTAVRTHRARFGLNYFHPSGFVAFARSTWRRQSLAGFDANGADFVDGARDFWITDLGLGYRFAHRRGQVNVVLTNIFDRDFRYVPSGMDTLVFPGFGAGVNLSYNF